MNIAASDQRSRILRILPPVLIFLLGAALRLIAFGQVPSGYHTDEAFAAWNAYSLYHGGIDSAGYSWPVYFEAWGGGQSALLTYLMLPLLALNGGEMNLYIPRIPEVTVALLTLIAVYFLMRKLFNERIALWAMFLTAICPWHIIISRWGLDASLAPGFLMFGFCFFVYGLEKRPMLLLSALCYGLSLYCYAVIWMVVPVILLLEFGYCLACHKLTFDKWLVLSGVIVALFAFPLVAFLLVNNDIIPSFKIGIFSVYHLTSYRGSELATSLSEMLANLKNALWLFYRQDVSLPYDIIMPYGFFYDIGRFFIVIGLFSILIRGIGSILRREFSPYLLLWPQLLAPGIVMIMITIHITNINCAYLPLVLSEVIGVVTAAEALGALLKNRRQLAERIVSILIFCIFLGNVIAFEKTYYTDYEELTSAWFQEGTEAAVQKAMEIASETGCEIYVNAGINFPNVLLFSRTPAAEYLETVVYSDAPPKPASFIKEDGTVFHLGFDETTLSSDDVYIIYYTQTDLFAEYDLIPYGDWWYVAVPQGATGS